MKPTPQNRLASAHREGEEGYLLLGLVVVCFLILLVLSVAAPRVAKELERDREVESENRALQYVQAIRLYYKKNGSYPSSVDQLMGSGATGGVSALNVKYLRQKYKDPLTNDEYRLIHFGEAQTEVKGFFGKPLEGAPAGNLGAVAGMQSSNGGGNSSNSISGNGTSPTGGTGASGTSSGFGSGGFSLGGTSGTGAAGSTSASTPGSTTGTTGASTTGTTGSSSSSTSATSFSGSKGAVIGVGSNGKGPAIVAWNGSDDIAKWEFLYDPRVELLKAKVSLFGGSPAATGNGSLTNVNGISGTSTPGSSLGTGINGTSTPGATPTGTPTGTSGTGTTPPTQ